MIEVRGGILDKLTAELVLERPDSIENIFLVPIEHKAWKSTEAWLVERIIRFMVVDAGNDSDLVLSLCP